MNTLWTFGDSQTFGHGCRPDDFSSLSSLDSNHHLIEYYKYKKDGDNIWPILLADKLKMNLVNCGKSGASNDYILDSIIDKFDYINENDYIILGKTFSQRFDFKNKETNMLDSFSVGPVVHNNLNKIYTKEEFDILLNFAVFFANDNLFKMRQDKRFDFIKKRLFNEKKIKIYQEWSVEDFFVNKIEKIHDHTKGKIEDGHFSFNGHKEMSEHFYNIIVQ